MIEAIKNRNIEAEIWKTYPLSENREKQIQNLPALMTFKEAEAELKKLSTASR